MELVGANSTSKHYRNMIRFNKMEINKFQNVAIPSPKDLYTRLGFRSLRNNGDDSPLVQSKMQSICYGAFEMSRAANELKNEPANDDTKHASDNVDAQSSGGSEC